MNKEFQEGLRHTFRSGSVVKGSGNFRQYRRMNGNTSQNFGEKEVSYISRLFDIRVALGTGSFYNSPTSSSQGV